MPRKKNDLIITMSGNILESTVKSASLNVIFQVFVKGITFLLNAFILRYITQEVVGVMNVRLLLLESTILFLSREAFRRAALSQRELCSWQQIINLIWLMVPLSLLISFICIFLWLYLLEVPPTTVTLHYNIAVLVISASCIIEIVGEPPFIVAQAYLFIKLKVVLSALVVLLRTIIFIPWVIYSPKEAVLAFSVAQIVANVAYCISYYYFFNWYVKHNSCINKIKTKNFCEGKIKQFLNKSETKNNSYRIRSKEIKVSKTIEKCQANTTAYNEEFPFTSITEFLPNFSGPQEWLHPCSAWLTWSFLKQGILKQILTEGEQYIMTLFSVLSFKEQGIYDIINNLGSLIVRFLFRPVEESLYFYFTQMISRDVPMKNQDHKNVVEVARVLHQSLSCFVDIGLLIFTFGQSYSSLLLYYYGGETIMSGEGPKLLRAHSFSVILLGINGITECYAFSTMTALQLNKYNYIMAAFSVMFLVVSWSLTKFLGGLGFIIANCCNMLARIFHSVWFIRKSFYHSKLQPLSGMIPTRYYFISLCVTLIITKISEMYCNNIQHFTVGVLCLTSVVGVWSLERQDIIHLAKQKWCTSKIRKYV